MRGQRRDPPAQALSSSTTIWGVPTEPGTAAPCPLRDAKPNPAASFLRLPKLVGNFEKHPKAPKRAWLSAGMCKSHGPESSTAPPEHLPSQYTNSPSCHRSIRSVPTSQGASNFSTTLVLFHFRMQKRKCARALASDELNNSKKCQKPEFSSDTLKSHFAISVFRFSILDYFELFLQHFTMLNAMLNITRNS